ncbi:MAG: adenylate/guanylate cyclase domain-containing protein, partial [Dehalococcoidia bacterium]
MRARLPPPLIGAVLVCSALWAGVLGLQHLSGTSSVLDRVEAVLVDLRYLLVGPLPAPASVIIVAIDDATVDAAGSFPIDRRLLASIVERITASGARALAVDLLLLDTTDAGSDEELATALESIPTVIAAAAQFQSDDGRAALIPHAATIVGPREAFAARADVGLANVATDPGGTPRHLPLVYETAEGLVPSFTLRAVGLFDGAMPSLGRAGLRRDDGLQPLDLGWHLPLRYYGPDGSIETISAQRLLDEPAAGGRMKGRLVLLGATATGIGDRFATPFDPILSGAEVQATGLANLIEQTALVRDPTIRQIDAVAAIALAVLGAASALLLSPAWGGPLCLFALASWIFLATIAFGQGYWLSLALPIATTLPSFGVAILVRQVLLGRATRQLTAAGAELARFQSPLLKTRIASDPSFLQVPVRLDAAILFVDLSGFTGLSERVGPADTQVALSQLHSLIVEVVSDHGGLVLNFMGDGAMVGFGLLDPVPETPARAVRTAFGLIASIRDWIAQSPADLDGLDVQVGLHLGPVMLSRLGHESQQQ